MSQRNLKTIGEILKEPCNDDVFRKDMEVTLRRSQEDMVRAFRTYILSASRYIRWAQEKGWSTDKQIVKCKKALEKANHKLDGVGAQIRDILNI